jgi:hypothetical protein
MNIYDPTFTSAQVAKAAGMESANFRIQFQRGNWRFIGKPAEANGFGHLFSICDALGFALARQLVLHGVDPKIAFERAMTDFALTEAEILDPDKSGLTLYVYSPGAEVGRCVGSKDVRDVIELLIPPMHNRATSAIIIVLNDLRQRVFHALGLDARTASSGAA